MSFLNCKTSTKLPNQVLNSIKAIPITASSQVTEISFPRRDKSPQ